MTGSRNLLECLKHNFNFHGVISCCTTSLLGLSDFGVDTVNQVRLGGRTAGELRMVVWVHF